MCAVSGPQHQLLDGGDLAMQMMSVNQAATITTVWRGGGVNSRQASLTRLTIIPILFLFITLTLLLISNKTKPHESYNAAMQCKYIDTIITRVLISL